MSDRILALVVHEHLEPFEPLKRVLRKLSVETHSVHTCREAENLMAQLEPHIIFTERVVGDGSWVRMLKIAETANLPANVIIVGTVPDTRFYIAAMERGAFDFVAPPFELEALSFVVRSAELDVRRRRVSTVVAAMVQ